MNELRDPIAYRIAIGSLGLGLAVLIAGIAWVAAVQEPGSVPVELWFALGALGGVFVGALMPFSVRSESSYNRASESDSCKRLAWGSILYVTVVVAIGIAATIVGLTEDSHELDVIGATAAGLLLGLPIPSPGRRGPRGRR